MQVAFNESVVQGCHTQKFFQKEVHGAAIEKGDTARSTAVNALGEAQIEAEIHNLKGAFSPHADGDASIGKVMDAAAHRILRYFDEGPMGVDGKIG